MDDRWQRVWGQKSNTLFRRKRWSCEEGAIRAEAQVQAEEAARHVVADPVHKEMALLEAMEAGHL
jgi:hypothetical protein